MPVTNPDAIYYASGSTPMSAEDISAAEATSVQAALDSLINNNRQVQTFVWANTTARNAQTGMVEGDMGYQRDTDTTYRYTGSAWVAFYPGGTAPVIPTSVAGAGTSLNVVTGLISFTSATNVEVDGCFTSAFRNYRIVVESTGTAANVAITLRTSGGVDSVTNYDRTELLGRNATASSSTSLNGANAILIGFANTLFQSSLEISGPQLAIPTTMLTVSGIHANPAASSTSNGIVANYITHRPSTSYAGFALRYSAAQSGTVRVYGLA